MVAANDSSASASLIFFGATTCERQVWEENVVRWIRRLLLGARDVGQSKKDIE